MGRLSLHTLIWSKEQRLYEWYTRGQMEHRFQPAEEATWLAWLEPSELDDSPTRFWAALIATVCQAVIAASTRAASQHMLASLERANLFLVHLDEGRRAYRLHDLFREALLSALHSLRTRSLMSWLPPPKPPSQSCWPFSGRSGKMQAQAPRHLLPSLLFPLRSGPQLVSPRQVFSSRCVSKMSCGGFPQEPCIRISLGLW